MLSLKSYILTSFFSRTFLCAAHGCLQKTEGGHAPGHSFHQRSSDQLHKLPQYAPQVVSCSRPRPLAATQKAALSSKKEKQCLSRHRQTPRLSLVALTGDRLALLATVLIRASTELTARATLSAPGIMPTRDIVFSGGQPTAWLALARKGNVSCLTGKSCTSWSRQQARRNQITMRNQMKQTMPSEFHSKSFGGSKNDNNESVLVSLPSYDYGSETDMRQKRRDVMQSAEAESETTYQSGFTKQ